MKKKDIPLHIRTWLKNLKSDSIYLDKTDELYLELSNLKMVTIIRTDSDGVLLKVKK